MNAYAELGFKDADQMLRGEFHDISEMKMMDCVVRPGRGVKIVVGPESGAAEERVEVVAV